MEHVYWEEVPQKLENQGGGVKFVRFKGGVKWDLEKFQFWDLE